ncbi:MAG: hemolysin family protein [Candidatus Hydrogenedens sp.]|nr:hemolysin family protein [Candidatus Hydrogenedens sp.]
MTNINWQLFSVFIGGVISSAFFAGYETGFISLNPIRVKHLSEKTHSRRAQILLKYLDNPDQLLIVLLLGTNISIVIASIALTHLLGNPISSLLVATATILFFGEILPKTIFRVHPNTLCYFFVPIIVIFDFLLKPLSIPIVWFFSKTLGTNQWFSSLKSLMRSPEDMKRLVEQGAEHGGIHEEERDLIHSVFDLQQKVAKEIMVPRIDICAVSVLAKRDDVVQVFRENRYTRIPVYEENIDRIIGIIKAFDLLKDKTRENQDIRRFIRPVMFITDATPLDEILKQMRQQHQTMAIVVDEYGGTAGLITLEDILEEIFGEIRDEHDQEELPVRQMGPGDYIVRARTTLEEFRETTKIELYDDEVETIGGWLIKMVQRIPQKGEVLIAGPFRITILDGKPNCITLIRMEFQKTNSHDVPKK